MNASIIIPTYNKADRLNITLKFFTYQKTKNNYEIILIDDASTDGTLQIYEKYKNIINISYIKNNVNKGRSFSRNIGVLNSKNELLIFCDDDMIISSDFIKNHMQVHNNNDSDLVIHGLIYELPYLKFFKNPVTGEFFENIDNANISALKKYWSCPTKIFLANS